MPAGSRLSFLTKLNIATRLFAIQGSWNYESLLGNGVGFCIEPALRALPGGRDGPAYREALARQSAYFNAHPYFAAIAVGALARAELDREPAERIERFRTALCGPLGSVGDRLVWAGWLPLCSLLALAAFGLGAGPVPVVGGFFVLYNVGHVGLRLWGLETGWTHGLRVAPSLGAPLLRQGPEHVARAAAVLAGIAVPLALQRVTGSGRSLLAAELAAVVAGAIVLARLHGRLEGWRIALGVLAGFVLFSVLRHG